MKKIQYNIKPSTLKQDVLWNMAANLCNAAHSVLMLALVSRFCGNEGAGVFSLSYSIAQMMYFICCFELANVLITDSAKSIGFRETVWFRILTNITAVVCAVGFGVYRGFSGLTMFAFLMLTMHMVLLSCAELCEGHLHRSNHLNLSGRSLAGNLILCDISFAVVLYFSRSIPAAAAAMCVVTILWILWYDVPFVRVAGVDKVKSLNSRAVIIMLIKQCLPLVCMRLVMSYIMNAPKLAIDERLTLVDQSYFGYMLMPASCVNLLSIFALRPQLVNMAKAYAGKDKKRFIQIVRNLAGWDGLVTVCVLTGGYFLGIPILSVFYGVDLHGLQTLLCTVLLGGCFYAFATLFDAAATTMRSHQWNLLIYIPTFVLSTMLAGYFVGRFGLIGAAISYTVMMLLLALGSGVVLYVSVVKKFSAKET